MTSVKTINDKFMSGRERLNDAELCSLLDFYKTLDNELEDIDSEFNLCKKEIRRRLEVLEGFDFHRKNP